MLRLITLRRIIRECINEMKMREGADDAAVITSGELPAEYSISVGGKRVNIFDAACKLNSDLDDSLEEMDPSEVDRTMRKAEMSVFKKLGVTDVSDAFIFDGDKNPYPVEDWNEARGSVSFLDRYGSRSLW